jgi:hypothetical protein
MKIAKIEYFPLWLPGKSSLNKKPKDVSDFNSGHHALTLCIGCSFKFPVKVCVEESIVNVPLV